MKFEIKILAAFPICAYAMLRAASEFSVRTGAMSADTRNASWLGLMVFFFSPVYLVVAHFYYCFCVKKQVAGKASLLAAIFYGLAVWVAIILYNIHSNLLPSMERDLESYRRPSQSYQQIKEMVNTEESKQKREQRRRASKD